MASAEIGIIGGSGLYSMPGFTNVHEERVETPFGAPSDAFVLGELEGRKVAFLARHGRGHRILPSELNFRANIYAMKKLGVERILSVSAVGSLKEEHKPTDFVMPDQFIDRTFHRIATFFGDGIVGHVAFGDPVCATVAKAAVGCLHSSRRSGQTRRHVRLHGRPAVLHQGRVESLPQLGCRRDRHDQSAGGQARPRSRDLLRHRRHGHRLRLLARGPRLRDD